MMQHILLILILLNSWTDATLDELPSGALEALTSGNLPPAALAAMAGGLVGGDNPLAELLSGDGLKSEFETLTNLVGDKSLMDKFSGNTGKSSEFSAEDPMMKAIKMQEMAKLSALKKGKTMKAALPLKKVKVVKAVKGKALVSKVAVKKLPIVALKMKKPKVHKLEPIVHVVEKPVPVFHKVPVPKKVLVPKFYPVFKPIPVPKIVPVPFKVPIKKIIPKIVKIPKPIPVPKFIPVKKYVPVGIPYPVPKFHKVPVPKPVPYKKFIPIPIPKKVPKFIPVPVKKIIKIPKPYYVPIKVPHVTMSYVKAPMKVEVPDIKKLPMKGGFKKMPLMKAGKIKDKVKMPLDEMGTNLFPDQDPVREVLKFTGMESAKENTKSS